MNFMKPLKSVFDATLAQLIGLRISKIDRLDKELRNFSYKKDPVLKTKKFGDINFSIVFVPEITMLRKCGDCDDSAMLANAIWEGQGNIYIIWEEISNKNSAGHVIFISDDGYLISNFRIEGDDYCNVDNTALKDIATRYVKNWKYIVKTNGDFQYLGTVER
jgi:hypothetical protein